MCADRLCHKLILEPSVHEKRKQIVAKMLGSILIGKTLSGTNLGKNLTMTAKVVAPSAKRTVCTKM